MGRSIYCSSCKKEKEPGRDNESKCKACKSASRSSLKAKKREEAGKEPWGSGRSLYCTSCNALKEIRDKSYCNECSRNKDCERRLKLGITSLICECGNEKSSVRKKRCDKCEKEITLIRGRISAKKYRAGTNGYKDKVRNLTFYAMSTGILVPLPCEVCSTTVDVEAHHDDYFKPLDVRWLCRKHHREHHKNEI